MNKKCSFKRKELAHLYDALTLAESSEEKNDFSLSDKVIKQLKFKLQRLIFKGDWNG